MAEASTTSKPSMIQTQFGLIRDVDIPILIPDSKARCIFYIALSVAITTTVILLMMAWSSKKYAHLRSGGRGAGTADIEARGVATISFLLPPGVHGRYFYIYPKCNEKIASGAQRVEEFTINGASRPPFSVEYMPAGCIRLDLGSDVPIGQFRLATRYMTGNISIRDATGIKVFSSS